MDFIESLLGGETQRRIDDLGDVIGIGVKWIIRCGCLLLLLIIAGMGLLIYSIAREGGDAVSTIIIIITMIVAVASLIRASVG